MELVITILPYSCSTMYLCAALEHRKLPFKWTSRTVSQSSSLILKVRLSRKTPALLIRMSIRPKRGRIGRGHIAIMLDREDYWQAGYVIPKGTYPELRREGIEALHRGFAELIPEFADRIEHLKDWQQASLLSVESSRCPRWYRPGLLLIGDAAHVMSPVGGVGINYAIQDAVVAANMLAEALKESQAQLKDLDTRYLAAVQRRRELPTRFIQVIQTQIQRRVLASVLRSEQPLAPPRWLRLLTRVPLGRSVPARIFGLGLWPVRVKNERSTHEHGS